MTRNSNDTPQRRMPTRAERKALERFARLEISLPELKRLMGDMLDFSFGNEERRVTSYFLLLQPGIRVEKKYIDTAMDKHAHGEISTEELSNWATMLLLNDAYDWQGSEEDEIADWLNEISMLTLKTNTEPE
jgi:hypothetical protein